ncbi:hypothetical protein GCM10018966_032400 [Streptomyces yanii]
MTYLLCDWMCRKDFAAHWLPEIGPNGTEDIHAAGVGPLGQSGVDWGARSDPSMNVPRSA